MNKLTLSILIVISLSIFSVAQEPTKTTDEAGEYMSRGDVKGAIAVLDKAIESNKDLFEAYRMRAPLRLFSGNLQGAVSDLDRALEIKFDASLFAQRAEYKGFLRDTAGALKDYDSAIASGYRTDKVYNGRASVKRNAGDLDGAIGDYRIAVGLNPESAGAQVGLASVLFQRGDLDEGVLILQTFLDRYEEKRGGKLPQSKTKIVGRTTIMKDSKGESGVDQILLGGKSSDSNGNKQEQIMNIALAYANLAQMLEQKGEFDKALSNVEKSISINQTDPYPIGLRGKIMLGKGNLENSIADLSTAIRMMPNIPSHYVDRGIALLLQGNDVQAQKDFDKFLQIFPIGSESLNKRIEEAKRKRIQNPSK